MLLLLMLLVLIVACVVVVVDDVVDAVVGDVDDNDDVDVVVIVVVVVVVVVVVKTNELPFYSSHLFYPMNGACCKAQGPTVRMTQRYRYMDYRALSSEMVYYLRHSTVR